MGSTLTNGPFQFNVAAVVLQCTNSASTLTGPKVLTLCIKARARVLPVTKYRWLSLMIYLLAVKGKGAFRGGLVLTAMPAGRLEDRWRLTAPLVLQRYCCVMLFCCGVGLSVCLNLKSLEKCLLLFNICS